MTFKNNKSLKSIHLGKKKINDEQGVQIANMLKENKFLLKLELEGNLLGHKTALEMGKALQVNNTLKFLDMENNKLTNGGTNNEQVCHISEALYSNKTLLHLNLANNNMNLEIGEKFVESTKENLTLICFEFGFNKFSHDQILEIQEHLVRNKAAYDAERKKEWKERKRMAEEERAMRILVTVEQKDEIMREEAERSRIAREKARDAAWKEFLMESELEKERLIQRLEDAAKMRKSKPKKKRGKKKK